jgi:two-component system chemotaxis response regulator CheY
VAQLLGAKLDVQGNAVTCAAASSAIAGGQVLLVSAGFNGSGALRPPTCLPRWPRSMAPQRSARVLVVEDDPALQKLVMSHLKRLGLEADVASNGVAAIQYIEAHKPDLVCLDLMLPRMSGYEVCEHIRRTPALQHIPILVMSARTLPEDRAHAEEVGASAYLSKPFTREQFATQVRALIKAPG